MADVEDWPTLDVEVVRALLVDQHPDLADRPIETLAEGWDNASFRLGDDLIVRVPRRPVAALLLEHERRWLPVVASDLPTQVPVPVRDGEASDRWPAPWSVVPYIDGEDAARAPRVVADLVGHRLADVLVELHREAPDDAPRNPFRGVPLRDRADSLADGLERLATAAGLPDPGLLLARWEDAVDAPGWDGPPVWLHGDLHAGNLIVDDTGDLAGIIDWGDVCAGDPATDLGATWMVLDGPSRSDLLDRWSADRVPVLGERADTSPGSPLARRTAGWALALGVAVWAGSIEHPESPFGSVPSYVRMAQRAVTAGVLGR